MRPKGAELSAGSDVCFRSASGLTPSVTIARSRLLAETADPTTQPGTVDRWLDQGRIFAVDSPGGPLFPAFQFAQGEPLPCHRECPGGPPGPAARLGNYNVGSRDPVVTWTVRGRWIR